MSSVAYPYTRTRSAQMLKRKDTQDSVHSGPEAKRPKRAVPARNTRSTPGSQVVVELTAVELTNSILATSNTELTADHTAGLSTSSDLTTRLTAETVTSTELRSANVRLLALYKQLEGKSGSEYAVLEQQYADSHVAITEKNDELYREWMTAADNVDVLNSQRLAGLERERVASLVIKQTAAAHSGEITALQVLAGTVKEKVRADRAVDLQIIASLRAEVEASHRKLAWGVECEASC